MANGSMGQIRLFSYRTCNWNIYRSQLQQYFIANNIPEDKAEIRRGILLANCDEESYQLISDLCVPANPVDLTYDEIAYKLDKHFQVVQTFYGAREKFYSAFKNSHESVNEWAARVRNLAAPCKFGNPLYLNEVLRDRFVMGFSKGSIKDRLHEEDSALTFEKAISIACKKEAGQTNEFPVGGVKREVVTDSVYRVSQRSSLARRGRPSVAGSASRRDVPHVRPAAPPRTLSFDRRERGYNNNQENRGSSSYSAKKMCCVCGKGPHNPNTCRYKDYICNNCQNRGHLALVCKKNIGNDRHNFLEEQIDCLYHLNSDVTPVIVDISIDNQKFNFELDTGASLSVISDTFKEKYFNSYILQDTGKTLLNYVGTTIYPLGFITLPITYQNVTRSIDVYVIKDGGPPLLGRDFYYGFKLSIYCIQGISKRSLSNLQTNKQGEGYLPASEFVIKRLTKQYANVFSSDIGLFRGGTIHLATIENPEPKFFKARPLPHGLRNKVEEELKRLTDKNIIRPVDYSEWGTPIVPIVKRDGSIRICGDYKVTVNPILRMDQYPLPRIEDLFSQLQGGVEYTKLDLSQAYQQLLLDDNSRKLTVISTHRGLFEYMRLPYGLSCAPAKFQKIIEQIFQGLDGVIVFLDDILITGRTREEHIANVEKVLSRLAKAGLTISLEKSEFFKESVIYLGHKIDKFGLHTCNDKIEAINKAPIPENPSQLKSFLGLVNYYHKFIPNSSTILQPLYNLLKKGTVWNWCKNCNNAFMKIKNVLASAKVLMHYTPELPLTLAVDASAYGVGAVISHQINENEERPIAYASQTLNSAQCKYSQIEREALAIIFGIKRFHQFLFNRKFTLITDHKPLMTIFGPNRGIPQMTANRLQRWALILSNYNYDIKYVPSGQNQADCFSRLPLKENFDEGLVEISYLNYVVGNSDLPVDCNQIREVTRKDPLLNRVMRYVSNGWPGKVPVDVKPFFLYKNQLTVEDGILMLGYRVVIPTTLQPKILSELHSTHQGIVKMKTVARSYVWWPQMNNQIENVAKSCEMCLPHKSDPPKAKLITWEFPTKPWERIHIDYLGPYQGKFIFVLVDAHSKWVEVFTTTNTKSYTTINMLRSVFARFGLPKRIVSDNARYFVSHEFKEFLEYNGIEFHDIPPFHPATNGAAESCVKIIKNALKRNSDKNNSNDLNLLINKILLNYRNTPHSTTNFSPAQLLLGRNLRTRLDLIKPNSYPEQVDTSTVFDNVIKNQKRQIANYPGKRIKNFNVNDVVAVRDYRSLNKATWIKAIIKTQLGPRTYIVFVPELQKTWKRHVNQIIEFNTSNFKTPNLEIDNKSSNENENSEIESETPILSINNEIDNCIPSTSSEMSSNNTDIIIINDRDKENAANKPLRASKRVIKKPERLQIAH